jgi:hypothetical protein
VKTALRHKIEDVDRKKLAILNAFRVAALSTQEKPLPHLARHYQDIMHLPHHIDDPKVYYDTLEKSRIDHNRAKGIPSPEVAHQPHLKALQEFYAWHYAHHPHMSPSEAREAADREVQIYQYEIEDKMAREKPDKPILEKDIFKQLERKLKNFVKPYKESAETYHPGLDHPDAYPGFHQHSCFGIAQAAHCIDKLLQAAREDIAKGGKGHHFRDKVLDLKLKHIGPKEIGLAWHLLSPNKSDLAYIDHLVLDALGINPKDVAPRDYPMYERMLIAARDGAGYDHMPLSHFQKGLTDAYQGPVSHEPLAVHDPLRVENADWTLKPAPHIWPDWWEETKPYREKVRKEWNENEGRYNPPQTVMAFVSSSPLLDELMLYISAFGNDTRLFIEKNKQFKVLAANGEKMSLFSDPHGGLNIVYPKSLGLPNQTILSGMTISHPQTSSVRITPTRIIHTRLQIDPKLATVGPNLDNSIPDPLANDAGDPMPSWEWQTQEPCDLCGGSQLVMMNGKQTACPSCTNWNEHKPFDDPPGAKDPVLDNPTGVQDLAPGTTGP